MPLWLDPLPVAVRSGFLSVGRLDNHDQAADHLYTDYHFYTLDLVDRLFGLSDDLVDDLNEVWRTQNPSRSSSCSSCCPMGYLFALGEDLSSFGQGLVQVLPQGEAQVWL